jgi:hypothetical protein
MGNVRVVDKGFSRLMRALGEGKAEHAATVGVHADEGSKVHEGGITNAEVAAIHEFGAEYEDEGGNKKGVPQRSFIRDWYDENNTRNLEWLRKLNQAVLQGKIPSVAMALDQFGALAAADVKKRIIAGIDPELKQSTKDRGGIEPPLIGKTTQLLNAVTWKVEK